MNRHFIEGAGMRKITFILSIVFLLYISVACTPEKLESKMHINKAELTQEEENIVDLIGADLSNTIFDFTVDETINAIQINTYKLKNGKWEMVSGGGQVFTNSKGRMALDFVDLANGMRMALQSEGTNGSVVYTLSSTDEFANMGRATTYLSNDTEIEYEKEIPLVIQISTTNNGITSYYVEYFNHPEEYQKLGYEHVYAVTVMFSQKTVSELNELGRNKLKVD